MYIEKYLQEDGWYKDDNGTDYETTDAAIRGIYRLNFCGCGDSDAALIYLRDGLQLVKELHSDLTYKEWEVKKKERYLNDGEAYFFWYYLDSRGFTAHGGSVPGWLTQEGEVLLQDLNEYLESINE